MLTAQRYREDAFRITAPIFYLVSIAYFSGLSVGIIAHLTKGNILASVVESCVWVFFLSSFLTAAIRKKGYRFVFGVAAFGGTTNFLLQGIQAAIDNGPHAEALVAMSLYFSLIFVAGGGLVVHRLLSPIFGTLALAAFGFSILFLKADFFYSYIILTASGVFGISAIIYFYKGMLHKAQVRLVQSNEATNQALETLKSAQDRILSQEKLSSLGQVVAGIAHEIKNPLNFIVNYAETSSDIAEKILKLVAPLVSSLDEKTQDRLNKYAADLKQNLNVIQDQGTRSDHIIQSMLMHSRNSEGAFAPENLNSIVDECLRIQRHSAKITWPTLQLDASYYPAPFLEAIEVVRGDLTQVFFNLLSNAFYSVAKKSELGLLNYLPQVTITAKDHGQTISITFWDNGIGISKDAQKHVFEPFYSTKPPGDGTGLGLSLSYEIVANLHGGRIAVNSVENEFAEFTITLPKSRSAISATPQDNKTTG